MIISSSVRYFVLRRMNRLVELMKVRIRNRIEVIGLWVVIIMNVDVRVMFVNR